MENEELVARLTRIEQKLDWIAGQLGSAPRPGTAVETVRGLTAEERMHADGGKLIQAIKLYRQRTGAGLREAKRAVDQYARR